MFANSQPLCAALGCIAGLLGCGGAGDPPPLPERCAAWPAAAVPATGTLVVSAGDVTLSTWKIGVDSVPQPGATDLNVTACVQDVTAWEDPPEGVDPWCIWEPWAFATAWRLEGPIDEPTMIPGATAVGRPGMAGLFGRRELLPMGCRGDSPMPETVETWMFMFNGAAELVVEQWSASSGVLVASGWVLTDGPNPVQVNLDLEIDW